MDKYAIMCIFILIILCLWHTGMSALVFIFTPDYRVTPDMWLARLDRYVCFIALAVFLITHLILVNWLYFVPLRYRRHMSRRDIHGSQELTSISNGNRIPLSRSRARKTSLYTRVRIEK